MTLDGWMLKPTHFRPVEALSGDRVRLRRAGRPDGHRQLGRRPACSSIAPSPRPATSWSASTTAARRRRRARRGARWSTARWASCRSKEQAAAVRALAARHAYRRSGARRRLGLERRRLEHAERDVPLPRRVSTSACRWRRCPTSALRHDLPGALHGPAAGERRRLQRRLADQLRRGTEGQAARHPRLRRRQRALPGHRAARSIGSSSSASRSM